MKIIKRNGAEEVFDIKKIVIAVTKCGFIIGREKSDRFADRRYCGVCRV